MAKKKPEDGGQDDGIEPVDDEKVTSAPLSEDERVELELLRQRYAAENAPPAAPPTPGKKWRGMIKHGVPIVVEAADEFQAERAYKEAAGIIHSEHAIEVAPAPDDAELGPVPVHLR